MSNKEEIQVQSPAQLQGCCIGCAKKSALVSHSFSIKYFKPINYLWLFVAFFPFLVAFFVFRKKLIIDASICKKCEKSYALWKKIGSISIIVLPINLIVGFNLGDPSLLFFNAITFTTIILSLMAYHKIRHGLRITGFDNDVFSVAGFSKAVLSIINNPDNN